MSNRVVSDPAGGERERERETATSGRRERWLPGEEREGERWLPAGGGETERETATSRRVER